jgi:hypothetical protein
MIPADLFKALQTLVKDADLDALVYNVRDHELKGWDGPQVTAVSSACVVIKKYASGKNE